MQEIEVKILEIDVPQVKDRLTELGTEKTFAGEVFAVSLDQDNKLKAQGSFIRLRKVGDKIELCFKGPKEDSEFKIREEVQVNTDDFTATLAIFNKLGFSKIDETVKQRESYKLGEIKFEIDTYPGLPPFLEIEAPSKEEVQKYVEKLGFTMEQATNMSGKDVIRHYQDRKNINQ